MSFAGNLEDLAIVDVIQLLHSTRKSGTLCVASEKGQSLIVFNNGFIVSANHCDDSIRIGKILVEMEAICDEILQETLSEQHDAGDHRKPLIGMLIEKNAIDKDVAYKGLECLIEMTIVEMVSWQRGTFTLDVDVVEINDEYQYIPEKLQQELNFNTQMVLLDALRIYDERNATGQSPAEISETDGVKETGTPSKMKTRNNFDEEINLSADMLGLDAIDQIEMQVPETFTSLEDFDPSELHRQKVRELLPDFTLSQREELVTYLTTKANIVEHQEKGEQDQQKAIILYGCDELTRHGLMSTCKYDGIIVFTAATPKELENTIFQHLNRSLNPVLVFDCPLPTQECFSKEDITAVRLQTSAQFPLLHVVQIASPTDYMFSLQSLTTGANSIIPRTVAENRRESFISEFIQFLESFTHFILGLSKAQSTKTQTDTDFLCDLREMQSASEIADFLLEKVSHVFERCMTLILRKDELFADKSFGIESNKSEGPSKPLRFKIPVNEGGLLSRVLSSGELFHSSVDDQTVRESIFGEISAPDKSKILLLPLVVSGKSIALIYADFGQSKDKNINIESLKSWAWIAGLTLEKAMRSNK